MVRQRHIRVGPAAVVLCCLLALSWAFTRAARPTSVRPADDDYISTRIWAGMDSAAAARAFGVTGESRSASPGHSLAGETDDDFDPLEVIDGPLAHSVAVEDFDQDGNLDALIVDFCQLRPPRVHFGDGRGGFLTYVDLDMSGMATTAHVNDDPYPDIIGWYQAAGLSRIVVQFGRGDRTFSLPIYSLFPAESATIGMAAGFVDDDDFIDVMVNLDTTTALFLGSGEGHYVLARHVVHGAQVCVGLGDLNDDGSDDLIVAHRRVEIYLNDGNGNFTLTATYDNAMPGTISAPASSLNGNIVDFDQDGHADIVFSQQWANGGGEAQSWAVILFGDGQGGIISARDYEVPGICYPTTVLDLNRDGILDIVSGSTSRQKLHLFYGDGEGGVVAESTFVVAPFLPVAMVPGDFREDGQWDLLIGNVFASSGVLLNLDPAEAVILEHEMRVTTTDDVRLRIIDPSGLPSSRLGTCIAGARRNVRSILSTGTREQTITNLNLQDGVYAVDVWPHSETPAAARYSVDITVGSQSYRIAQNAAVPHPGDTIRFVFPVGDAATVDPAPGSFVPAAAIQFGWSEVIEDSSPILEYEFQLADQHDFATPLLTAAGLHEPAYALTQSLASDSLYYWRFRSRDPGGWDAYSPAFAVNTLQCACPCHADPLCNGGTDLIDVVMVSNVAFRGVLETESVACPIGMTDVDCSGETDVIDVVRLVNVYYRNEPPETQICGPCDSYE